MAGPRGIAWSELPPEVVDKLRADNRRRRKLAELGRPSLVPSGPAIERVRLLHDHSGMTFREIAQRTPLMDGKTMAQSTVSDLYKGYRSPGSKGGSKIEKIPRTTQDRIMAVEIPAIPLSSKANVDATGTRRRLQALACVGFGARYISEQLGHNDWNMVWRLTVGKETKAHRCKSVFASTREAIAELYEKLHDADPADHGITPIGIGRTKSAAREHGFAPPHCWDPDTIDNPDAFPEWTGACGTTHGRTVHLRERIPMCQPCKTAHTDSVRARRGLPPLVIEFSREKFAEQVDRKGISLRKLAEKAEVSVDSISGWKNGSRRPGTDNLFKVAAALGIDVEELVK